MNNQDMYTSPHTQRRIGLYVFISFLVVILGSGIYVYRAKRASEKMQYKQVPTDTVQSPPPMKKVVSAIKKIDKGTFTIALGGANRVPVGSQLNVLVSVDSAEYDIVAYDTLLSYDKKALKYIDTTSSVSDFTVLPRDNGGYVTVTAYKDISSHTPSIFAGDELFSTRFTALKKGKYKIKISPSVGVETTKLVDIKKTVVRPKAAEISVEIY